jgi:hypothetical protein
MHYASAQMHSPAAYGPHVMSGYILSFRCKNVWRKLREPRCSETEDLIHGIRSWTKQHGI